MLRVSWAGCEPQTAHDDGGILTVNQTVLPPGPGGGVSDPSEVQFHGCQSEMTLLRMGELERADYFEGITALRSNKAGNRPIKEILFLM